MQVYKMWSLILLFYLIFVMYNFLGFLEDKPTININQPLNKSDESIGGRPLC